MTNNNNRSADDLIVYVPTNDAENFGIATGFKHKAAFIIKPINLSELAEKLKKMPEMSDSLITDRVISFERGYDFALDEFLSKIREAMK